MTEPELRKQEVIILATISQQEQINTLREKLSAVTARLDESARAQDIYVAALDRRLEGMNEFRAAIQDANASFLTRAEYSSQHGNLAANLQRVERILAEAASRVDLASLQRYVYMALGGLGAFGALMQIMLYLLNRPLH